VCDVCVWCARVCGVHVFVCVCVCVCRQKDTQKLRWHDVELKTDRSMNDCTLHNNKPHSRCEVARPVPERPATWSVFWGMLGRVRKDLPN